MAKVLISMPEDVLERLDERARAQGATRSGFLRDLVERDLEASGRARDREVKRLLARPGHHGGQATVALRESRRSR
jgi:metal-responsive CopG/Arc/MetJ family transcriptional regulator